MDYEKIRLNEKQFLSLTSLKVSEFDELLSIFSSNWERFIHKFKLDGKPRLKKYTPKSSTGLNRIEDKLFFILVYLKNNPLQEFHAASFNIEQDMCNKWIHILTPLANKSLSAYKAARTTQELTSKIYDNQSLYGDATERPINRPEQDQADVYSGKKKQHTLKNFLLCCACGFVVYLGKTVSGRIFDKTVAQEQLAFEKPVELKTDLGFKGLKLDNMSLQMPHKKPRMKELTKIQKKENQVFSSERVIIEHVIGHIKILRIVKDKNRNTKHGFRDLVMDTAVSLHNFRVAKRRIKLLKQFTENS